MTKNRLMEEGVYFRFRLQNNKRVVKQSVPLTIALKIPRFVDYFQSDVFAADVFDVTDFGTTLDAIVLLFKYYLRRQPLPHTCSCQNIFDLIRLCHRLGVPLTSTGFLFGLTMSLSETIVYLVGAKDTYFSEDSYLEEIVWGIAADRTPYMKLDRWDRLDHFYVAWSPERHRCFSDSFRRCAFEFLLCWKRIVGIKLPKDILAMILNNFTGVEDRFVVTARNFDIMPDQFRQSVIHSYLQYCFGWDSRDGRQSLDLYIKWEMFFFHWPFMAQSIQSIYFKDDNRKSTLIGHVNTPVKRRSGLLKAKTPKAMLDYLFQQIPDNEYCAEVRRAEQKLAKLKKTAAYNKEAIIALELKYVRLLRSQDRKRDREDRKMRCDMDSDDLCQRSVVTLGLLQ
jgi:hypothetical protein